MEIITTVYVNDVALDGGIIPRPVRVVHGRSSTDTQPDAPQAEFEYLGPFPPCEVGDQIRIGNQGGAPSLGWGDASVLWGHTSTSWTGFPIAVVPRAAQEWTRFVGWASQINAIEQDGIVVAWKVSCTGNISRLGLIPLEMERPAETDLQRVAAIAAAAGVTVNVLGDAALRLGIDAIDRSALAAIQEVCASTGGLFWQSVDGQFWYGASNHRDRPTQFVVPASVILDGLNWDIDANDIVNSVRILYPAPRLPAIPPTGRWTWATSTDTGADPGAGQMRTNADANSTSTIALSFTNSASVNLRSTLKRLVPGSRITLTSTTDPTKWVLYNVTDQALDNGTYFQITVDFVDTAVPGAPAPGAPVDITADYRVQEEQNSIHAEDAPSIAQWGRRHVEIETLVEDDGVANLLSTLILARHAQPFWIMPNIIVPYEEVGEVDFVTLQRLDVSVGTLIPADDEPSSTPAPVHEWAIEGFVEEWREDGYWAQFSLSDWSRTSSSSINTWQGVKDELTWATAAAKTYRALIVEVT